MKTSNKFATLLAIATANPAGFTVDAATLEPVAHGFACAVADTQNSFGTAGLARVIDFVNAHPGTVSAFGGWLDDKTGFFLLGCHSHFCRPRRGSGLRSS